MRLSIKHFVATSLLAHATLFVAWASTQSHTLLIPATPASAPVIEVALQNAVHPVKPMLAKAMHHSTHKTKPRHALLHAIANIASIASASPVDAATAVASAYPAQVHRNEIRDRVLSKIRNDLQQYFVYPLLARRQGWQGEVLLGFSVEANGMIRNIHVAAGSGYAILDTSAVDALSRVQHLYEVSDWLQGERLDMEMPVIFRLQGG